MRRGIKKHEKGNKRAWKRKSMIMRRGIKECGKGNKTE